ncbi:MAG: CoA activase, partial [Desulfobacterales bacterium]|nr:CoA activase [Desulfobacterales bacterium]
QSKLCCNLALIPHHLKTLLDAHGRGFQKAGVYTGSISLFDISAKLPVSVYFSYMFGGLVRKMGCKVRPYETAAGSADAVIERSMEILEEAFGLGRSREEAVKKAIALFKGVKTSKPGPSPRPLVAIFGDLYARDNEVINQGLLHFIEANGGEALTTPYSYLGRMVARPYLRKWLIEGLYLEALATKALIASVRRREKRYYAHFQQILKEPAPVYDDSPGKILARYNIRMEHTGESMENILKIFYTLKQHPRTSLFVQTSPAFCCPSLVTEAMAREIERNTGVPVVSVTYDGTGGNKNEAILPYLKFSRQRYRRADSL